MVPFSYMASGTNMYVHVRSGMLVIESKLSLVKMEESNDHYRLYYGVATCVRIVGLHIKL